MGLRLDARPSEGVRAPGHLRAWEALREVAATGDERAQDGLATSGEAGLLWAERNVLPTLAEEDRYRVASWLPDEEADDATPTQRRLREVSRQSKASWERRRAANVPTKPDPGRFLRDIREDRTPGASPRDFAKAASAGEWREAAEILLRTTNPRVGGRIALAFRILPFPLPLSRHFPHATHEARGPAVCQVLGRVDSPQVRGFALELLQMRPLRPRAIRILTASFRAGDEALIGSILPDVEGSGRDVLHDVVLDVVELLSRHRVAPWQPHAEWVYEHSPCSMCRAETVRWMANHGMIPPSLLLEMSFDAESEIREIAARFTPLS